MNTYLMTIEREHRNNYERLVQAAEFDAALELTRRHLPENESCSMGQRYNGDQTSGEFFMTYEDARSVLIEYLNLTGRVRVLEGVIILVADFGNGFIRVTGRLSEMAEHGAKYKEIGRRFRFIINPLALDQTGKAGE